MKSVASMAVSLPSRRGAAHLARPRSLKGSARMLRCVAVADEEAIMAEYLKGTDVQHARAYSPAVVTEGGRTVLLAGQIALTRAAAERRAAAPSSPRTTGRTRADRRPVCPGRWARRAAGEP